jgi:septal ring factor EnvC (AmiA/AmiB activator)
VLRIDERVKRIARGHLPATLIACIGLICAALHGAVAAPEKPTIEAQANQLDTLRVQCITAAHDVQQRERALGALALALSVMQRGVAAKDQQVAQSRKEQEELLGALERLARAPPEALAFAPEGPVDRLRSGILIAAAVPALTAQAREFTGQLSSLGAVRKLIDARRKDIDDARAALAKARDALAQCVTRRNALIGQILRNDGKPLDMSKIAVAASDLFDLIKRADAENDRRDLNLLIHLRVSYGTPRKGAPALTDPTRPKSLRALDAANAELMWPIRGEVAHSFGEADPNARPSQGLTLAALPNGTVVAPFDGRVDYVGRFRDFGLVLIIRHGGGYHSVLAGLGEAEVAAGQWLLAGEPVGSLPGTDDKNASVNFYLELRHDGRPVDPKSRLGSLDQKTEDTKVRE